MSIIRNILCFLLAVKCIAAYSQDIQFSQLYAAPLLLNPALTGISNDNYHIGTNYKNQWVSLEKPFQTFSIYYDQSFCIDTASGERVGFGVMLNNDKAGNSQLSTTEVNVALSYQAVNKSNNQYFSVGFEGGIASRSINYSKLTWGSQISGDQLDPSIISGENFPNGTKNYFDFSSGVLWYYIPSEKFKMFSGISLFHINKPDQSLLDNSTDRLYTKISVHSGMQISMDKSERTYFIPLFSYFNQGTSNRFNIGGFYKYIFESKSENSSAETSFQIGGFYRIYSAAAVIGFNLKNFNLGMSYDFNVAMMNNYFGANGGIELSLRYTNFGETKNKVKYISL